MRPRLALAVPLILASCAHEGASSSGASSSGASSSGSPLSAMQGLVLPPAEAGAFRSSVSGCAAGAPVDAPATRALPPPEKVEASAVATGLVLTHALPHACCLTAATTVAVEQRKVTVTETLSGTPCRCLCGSTVRTAVGLGRGAWAVEVRTVTPTSTRVAWTGDVTVP